MVVTPIAVALAAAQVGATQAATVARHLLPDLGARAVVVDVVAGDLRIVGWARPGVDIQVALESPEEKDALHVLIDDAGPDLVVRVGPSEASRGRGPAPLVSLWVPAAAHIRRFAIQQGSAHLQQVRGTVDGRVERGPVTATEVAGVLRIETGVGDISMTRAEVVPGGLIRLRTFDGAISLHLGKMPTDARLLAHALTGHIRSRLPLSPREGFGGRLQEGVFGSGQTLVSLDTVRGDIDVTADDRR